MYMVQVPQPTCMYAHAHTQNYNYSITILFQPTTPPIMGPHQHASRYTPLQELATLTTLGLRHSKLPTKPCSQHQKCLWNRQTVTQDFLLDTCYPSLFLCSMILACVGRDVISSLPASHNAATTNIHEHLSHQPHCYSSILMAVACCLAFLASTCE